MGISPIPVSCIKLGIAFLRELGANVDPRLLTTS